MGAIATRSFGAMLPSGVAKCLGSAEKGVGLPLAEVNSGQAETFEMFQRHSPSNRFLDVSPPWRAHRSAAICAGALSQARRVHRTVRPGSSSSGASPGRPGWTGRARAHVQQFAIDHAKAPWTTPTSPTQAALARGRPRRSGRAVPCRLDDHLAPGPAPLDGMARGSRVLSPARVVTVSKTVGGAP